MLDNKDANEKSKKVWEGGESIEFSGKAVTRLASDDELMNCQLEYRVVVWLVSPVSYDNVGVRTKSYVG